MALESQVPKKKKKMFVHSLLSLRVCLATIAPRFSWDTIQPFLHLANKTGPFQPEAFPIMAKFPIVTIDKYQGPCASHSTHAPSDTCHEEDLIVDVLKKVKAINPSVCTIFYMNSILNFPTYDVAERFLANNARLSLHATDGTLITVDGGGTTNMTVFDFQQQAACDLWADTCINATKTGFVDGCFADRAVDKQSFEKNGQLNDTEVAAFDRGHWGMLAKLQTTIGAGPVIANHAYNLSGVGASMIEFGKADHATLKDIQKSVANGKLTQAHFLKLSDSVVALFLIGAGENTYFGEGSFSIKGKGLGGVANRWHSKYFDRPLGEPLSDAVESRNGSDIVYARKFSKGTNVTLTCFHHGKGACRGSIEWGDSLESTRK